MIGVRSSACRIQVRASALIDRAFRTIGQSGERSPHADAARYACLPRRDLSLNVGNQSPLRAGVAVDIALRRLDRTMPREQLDVAQAAAGAVDVAGGEGDEATPAGMRRAALVAQLLEERDEPIHNAVRLQVRAAIGADHRADGLDRQGQLLESA